MLRRIDINCDLGEGFGNDAAIMPYIRSANIACGFHAGNTDSIRRTIDLALQNRVHVGAHPSFRDKENFGRTEMRLPAEKIYAIVIEQLIKVELIAKERGAVLHHVKPHGALYNMASRDAGMAKAIVQAVHDYRENLILYALSGSCMISEARALGLETKSEVFADRTYQENGFLTSRRDEHALIDDEERSLQQVLEMVHEGTVTTVTGKKIPVLAETVCIHGDGKYAVRFAKALHGALFCKMPETKK